MMSAVARFIVSLNVGSKRSAWETLLVYALHFVVAGAISFALNVGDSRVIFTERARVQVCLSLFLARPIAKRFHLPSLPESVRTRFWHCAYQHLFPGRCSGNDRRRRQCDGGFCLCPFQLSWQTGDIRIDHIDNISGANRSDRDTALYPGKRLGLDQQLAGIDCTGLANSLVIFLFRQFFEEIPQDLIDAARVDGATWLNVFYRIILPLSRPVMITAALLMFLSQWDSFFWPLLVSPKPELRVVQVEISNAVGEYQTLWNELLAGSMLAAVVPIMLVLPFQRYFVQAITSSGLKD